MHAGDELLGLRRGLQLGARGPDGRDEEAVIVVDLIGAGGFAALTSTLMLPSGMRTDCTMLPMVPTL